MTHPDLPPLDLEATWSDYRTVGIAIACCSLGAAAMMGACIATAKYLPGFQVALELAVVWVWVLVLLLVRR